jgi:hypothetical protein
MVAHGAPKWWYATGIYLWRMEFGAPRLYDYPWCTTDNCGPVQGGLPQITHGALICDASWVYKLPVPPILEKALGVSEVVGVLLVPRHSLGALGVA